MIIQGRQLIQIFPSKGGDYSREVFNKESTWLLFEECMGYVISRQGN